MADLEAVLECLLDINHFYNIDLRYSGYYQIRTQLKPHKKQPYRVEVSIPRSVAPHLFPASVLNGQAVGTTFEILYRTEEIVLDDVILFKIFYPLHLNKTPDTLHLSLVVQLWYIEKDGLLAKAVDDVYSKFECVSSRTLRLSLNLLKSLQYRRPLIFDYYHLSALTFTLHLSLIGLEFRNFKIENEAAEKKATHSLAYSTPQDAVFRHSKNSQQRLQNAFACHYKICRLLLTAYEALELTLCQFLDYLPKNCQIRIQSVDCAKKFEILQHNLLSLSAPHSVVDESEILQQVLATTKLLSTELALLWRQFLDLFKGQPNLKRRLAEEHQQQRVRRFAESFLFREFCISRLLAESSCESQTSNEKFVEIVRKSDYFHHLPNLPVSCDDLDGSPLATPIIFEHLFQSTRCKPPISHHVISDCSFPVLQPQQEKLSRPEKLILQLEVGKQKLKAKLPERRKSISDNFNNWHRVKTRSLQNFVVNEEHLPYDDCKLATRSYSLANDHFSCADEFAIDQTEKVDNDVDHVAELFIDFSNEDFSIVKGQHVHSMNENGQATYSRLTSGVDAALLKFLGDKESIKAKLQKFGFEGHLRSDFAKYPSRTPYFEEQLTDLSQFFRHQAQQPAQTCDFHLVVCVHGLEGTSADLKMVRTYLELALPYTDTCRVRFLMSKRNQINTFENFETMTKNLVDELLLHLSQSSVQPSRISFIGHSLGNIIIRSALSDPRLEPMMERLYTFLSLNGPHCGLLYNTSSVVNIGLKLVQRLKKSISLQQLSLKDNDDLRECFLYKLSQKPCLEYFKNVLLVGSSDDYYVPIHSALVEHCKASSKDTSITGQVYNEMVQNLLQPLTLIGQTNVVKYSVYHSSHGTSAASQFLGRAAHVAVLDSDLFIEKLITVSALKYFQ